MAKLRIVIPTKNEEAYLPKLLDSIKHQKFQDFEIVVADGGSKDKTKSIAKKYNCKIVKGGHPAIGRNNGAKKCKAFLVCFIDSDIKLPDSRYFERVLKEFNQRGLEVAGALQKPISTGNFFKDFIYRLFYEFANLGMILLERTENPMMQTFIIMKTRVHKDIGGFPHFEFGEDSAFAKMAVAKEYKFGILKKSGKVFVSPRRLEKNGFIPMLVKYIYFNGMRLFGHEFKIGKSKKKYF